MAELTIAPDDAGSHPATAHRSATGLQPPPGSGRPIPICPAVGIISRAWYRACAIEFLDDQPWFFSSRPDLDTVPEGRFDLLSPEGTCYVANDPEVAVRERIGHAAAGNPLTTGMLLASMIAQVVPTTAHVQQVADTTVRGASNVVTRDISGDHHYERTAPWAQHWRETQSCTAVYYLPRYSTGADDRSLAIFGRAGRRRRNRRTTLWSKPAVEVLTTRLGGEAGPVGAIVVAVADIEE